MLSIKSDLCRKGLKKGNSFLSFVMTDGQIDSQTDRQTHKLLERISFREGRQQNRTTLPSGKYIGDLYLIEIRKLENLNILKSENLKT